MESEKVFFIVDKRTGEICVNTIFRSKKDAQASFKRIGFVKDIVGIEERTIKTQPKPKKKPIKKRK